MMPFAVVPGTVVYDALHTYSTNKSVICHRNCTCSFLTVNLQALLEQVAAEKEQALVLKVKKKSKPNLTHARQRQQFLLRSLDSPSGMQAFEPTLWILSHTACTP